MKVTSLYSLRTSKTLLQTLPCLPVPAPLHQVVVARFPLRPELAAVPSLLDVAEELEPELLGVEATGRREHISPAITPDGPREPRREFKPGAILIAQMTGRPLLPMAYAASRVFLFPTWDRFALPWPFARIVLAVGEPRVVPKGLDADALARWQSAMRDELNRLYAEARASLSGEA